MTSPTRRSLVLSGGGARGAYEAGVLSYIFNEIPEATTDAGRLGVLSGTSVGAINASFVASRATCRAAISTACANTGAAFAWPISCG